VPSPPTPGNVPASPQRTEPEVVCLGETMAMLSPPDSRPLAEQPSLVLAVGGAESNVACALAALGHRSAWLSRVGADPFGRRILAELAARGVDVSAVEVDPARQTGVYFKDPGPGRTTTHYYRRDSAATLMGPGLARHALLRQARVVHLSGITTALSGSCRGLIAEVVTRRAVAGPVISFDVNYRPALWRPTEAAPTLLELARGADIVFVGRDEAESLWGTAKPAEIRDLLQPAPLVVVKDGGRGATSYAASGETFVSTPRSHVVEAVGAGDAFAAGYLAGLLEDLDEAGRLRLGHLVAAVTMQTRTDVPVVPPRPELDRHLALDDTAWTALSIS
jgi:2-dehydro-3-deoxygluconokinase